MQHDRVIHEMNGDSLQDILDAVTVCVALAAAFYDMRERRIPNVLTAAAVTLGLLFHSMNAGLAGLFSSALGMGVGGGLFLIFYMMGAMGAGDVKLAAGIGALLGIGSIFTALVLTGIIGGVMAIGSIVVWHARRYVAGKAVPGAGTTAGAAGDSVMGQGLSQGGPLKETIPYGVAIAAGTIMTLIAHIFAGGIR